MKLSSDSRLVSFVYQLSDWGPPRNTTLCRFFWRFIAMCALYCLPIGLIIGIIMGFYYDPVAMGATLGSVIFIASLVTSINYLGAYLAKCKYERELLEDSPEYVEPQPSKIRVFVSTAYWGIKNRVCPTITFD